MLKKIGGAVVAIAPLSAFAAVDAAVTTALTDARADGAPIASGAFLLIFGIAVWRHLRGAK